MWRERGGEIERPRGKDICCIDKYHEVINNVSIMFCLC